MRSGSLALEVDENMAASLSRFRILGCNARPWAGALVLSALPAAAQEPVAAQEPTPPAAEPPKIDVTGFVDVYYTYNFNKTDPAFRSFDVQHNAFSLSLAEIAFAKGVTTDSRIGFRADLDFGKTADLVGAYEPEENGQEIYKHIQQAYVTALAGEKLTLDFGKFVTPHGAEVIESQDNWNYSRSTLFGYAIPFYHTGVRAALPVNDKLTFTGYVVNGWNNSSEMFGSAPCLALGTLFKPTSKVTWAATIMTGQEVPDPADNRTLFDTTLTVAATPKFSVMANFDYGKEGATSWWGIAGYAKYQARDNWALVGRFEYLDDTDGGFMLIGQKAQTLTLTSDHLVAGGLKLRLEYRGDFTDSAFFVKDNGSLKDSQHAVIVGMVYAFGGKI